MTTITIGALQEIEDEKYSHSADVRLWRGDYHISIGSLRQRKYPAGWGQKLDFVPCGEFLADDEGWYQGFNTLKAAENFLAMLVRTRLRANPELSELATQARFSEEAAKSHDK